MLTCLWGKQVHSGAPWLGFHPAFAAPLPWAVDKQFSSFVPWIGDG